MHCALCPRQEDRFGSDYFVRLDTNDCLEAFGFFLARSRIAERFCTELWEL